MADPDIHGARRAASQLLEEYCITDPTQICIHDIAYDRHVLVREEDLIGAEGRLLRKGQWGIVRVRPNPLYPGRVRFSIAHELGHWERHMQLSQAWLCSSRDIHAYSGSAAEIEANAFAGELLMPSSLLRPKIYGGLSIAMLCDVASEFDTSLTATAVRAIEETDEDAYVIFSQDGITLDVKCNGPFSAQNESK
ncbi:MAG: ImmA/IrrE family metallo-endopeptidase [Acidobacteriota bacterium]|nr:ImmA/IrrE family metallo-endopeptidase [Acidobacteriota bacterium]